MMKNTVKIMIISMVLAGGTTFIKLAKDAYTLQSKRYAKVIENNELNKQKIRQQAEIEAQKALDTYNNELSGHNSKIIKTKLSAEKSVKGDYKFDNPEHKLKDLELSDIDLASLKTEDFNIKFVTQDSDVRLKLWKKNPKQFLDNRI